MHMHERQHMWKSLYGNAGGAPNNIASAQQQPHEHVCNVCYVCIIAAKRTIAGGAESKGIKLSKEPNCQSLAIVSLDRLTEIRHMLLHAARPYCPVEHLRKQPAMPGIVSVW